MEQPQQPKPSVKRAPKGFEIALSSLCALLVAVAIGHFAYSMYWFYGGNITGWAAYSLAVDWVIIILVGALFVAQVGIMTGKMPSGVHQYYNCIAFIVVSLIILIMTAAQAGNDIKVAVDSCSGSGVLYDPYMFNYYYGSYCIFNYTNGIIFFSLEIIFFGFALGLFILACLRLYQVKKLERRKGATATPVVQTV